MINCAASNLKAYPHQKTLLEKLMGNLHPGEKYSQNIYLTKDLYSEYIKNPIIQ